MTRNRSHWCLALLAGLAVGRRTAAAEVDEALLKLAQEGNRAALAAITSMSFRYERTWVQKPQIEDPKNLHFSVPSGRYWYTPATYRLQDQLNGQERDLVVRGGKTLIWGYGPNSPNPGLSIFSGETAVGKGNPWEYLLFHHHNRDLTKEIPFSQILSQPHTLNEARRVPHGSEIGSGNIHINLAHDWCRLELRFDPGVSYLVRHRVVVPTQAKHILWENEVLAFAEPTPGVFIPTTIEHRCSVNGEVEAIVRTTLTEVQVNAPLGPDAFRIPNIAGMECSDPIRKVRYMVDTDGHPIGPEIPWAEVPIPPPFPHPIAPTERPPTQLWDILGLSIVFGIPAWLILRRRGRNEKRPS